MDDIDLGKDRALRDRAQALFQNSLERVREDRNASTLVQRSGRRLVHGASGLVEDASSAISNHVGKVALAGAGLAAWFGRDHISRFLADHLPGHRFDDSGEPDGGEKRPEEES